MDKKSAEKIMKIVHEYKRIKELTYIPLLHGRPERTKIINDDDICNLSILLNTEDNFEAFVAKL